MKKTIVIVALAFSVLGCSMGTTDVYEDALVAKVASMAGEGAKVRMFSIERVDSVTVGEELSYRIQRMESKASQEKKFYDKYLAEGKKVNASKHLEAYVKTCVSLERLASLKETIAPLSDSIAYYVYGFSGEAVTSDGKVVFDDYFASLTPGSKVLTVSSSRKDLRETLGSTVPGYREIITMDNTDNQ